MILRNMSRWHGVFAIVIIIGIVVSITLYYFIIIN